MPAGVDHVFRRGACGLRKDLHHEQFVLVQKASVFRVNAKQPASGDGYTQFGRAMGELNIDTMCANTPQAKGRVERANSTLQDRLVKELRLANISSINDGQDIQT